MAEITFEVERPRPRGFKSAEARARDLQQRVWETVLDPRSGKPRLRTARGFFRPLEQDDIGLLCSAFVTWRDFTEYGIMKGVNNQTGELKFVHIKMSKRGNDVFAYRMRTRLAFLEVGRKHRFFDISDFRGRNRSRKVKSPILWVTLTFNTNLCSLQEAWERFRSDFNLWITNLRNRYGKIWYVAFPQAGPDSTKPSYGYPHIHLVMLFEDAEFSVFPRYEKDKQGRIQLAFRIEEKYQIENQGKWPSFIDVKALSSMRGVLNYARKYAENVAYGDSGEAEINNAVMWLMRKRSYSVSGKFREAYHDLISRLRNSKLRSGNYQKTLSGEIIPIWTWTFLGVWPASDLGLEGDPPPWTGTLEKELVEKLLEKRN